MHSGYILKDYSKKVKRPAGFRQGAVRGKAGKPPHPQRSKPPCQKGFLFDSIGKAPPRKRRGFAVLIWFQARRSVCMTFFMRPEPSLLSK